VAAGVRLAAVILDRPDSSGGDAGDAAGDAGGGGARPLTSSGHTWAFWEVLCAALLLAVLGLEVTLLAQISGMQLTLAAPGTYFAVWTLLDTWQSLRDLVAVLVFILCLRFLSVLGVLPFVGPQLTALLRTLGSAKVIMSVCVVLLITLISALAHALAFGSESFNFGIFTQAFYTTFVVSFGSDVSSYFAVYPRFTSTLFFIVWLVLAALLFNLLIAVVQDAFALGCAAA
jgi:hypothetical protein